MSGCSGNCQQGRLCDCGEGDWPALRGWALVIALIIVAMAALVPIFFTAPWWTP